MLVGYITMLPDDYENLSQSVIATNCFGNNILASITQSNYWDISNDYKPLMHTWYVGVIMQFYIVYPILFYLARLDKRNPKGTLHIMLATLAVISLLVYFATTDTAQRFYYLPSRFFEFAVGGIAALLYKPQEDKPFGKGYVYVCYIILIALMFVNADVIPAIIRLVAVVGLSCVLLCSQDVLENKVTGNVIISKIGAASYSIFIWHQVILAFYRYTTTSKFTIGSYAILLIATVILSWLSYRFIEQGVTKALKTKRGKIALYSVTAIVFVALSIFAGIIYLRAGVVRDVPELDCYVGMTHRGMHAEYNDNANRFREKHFETNKKHWLILGNSFANDFANLVQESSIKDEVEIVLGWPYEIKNEDMQVNIKNADRVFISFLGIDDNMVNDVLTSCLVNGIAKEQLFIVGEKNWGQNMGQLYQYRHSDDYFNQTVQMSEGYLEKNNRLYQLYKDQYIDLISVVLQNDGRVKAFTDCNKYISQDTKHFTQSGALCFKD